MNAGGTESPSPGTSVPWKAHTRVGPVSVNKWFNELVAQDFIRVLIVEDQKEGGIQCVCVHGDKVNTITIRAMAAEAL